MTSDPSRDPLRRVVQAVGSDRWWVMAAAGLAFVSLGSGIGLIAMSSYLISESALVDSTATLGLTIVAVRFFAVTRVVSRYAERYVGHLGTFRILTRIRVWFFRGLVPVAPAALAEQRSGDVLTRIVDDVETLQDLYLRVLVPPLAAALAIALGCAILGSLSPVLGLVLFLYVMLCGVVLPLAARHLSKAPAEELITAHAQLHTVAVEGVTGLADLVAFGRQDLLVGELDRLTGAQRHLRDRLANARGLAAATTSLLVGLAASTVLAIAVVLVRDGRLDAVMLAVVPLVAIATFEAIGPLTAAFEHLDRSRAAAIRLIGLTDTPPEVVDPREPLPPPELTGAGLDLEFSGVTFRYQPDRPDVLTDATFVIPGGTNVAITGPSGSGKSTLTNLLMRFWDYHEGSIRIGSVEVREMAAADARRLVALVAQRDHLFDTTLRDNLCLGDDDADDDRLWAACEATAIAETVRALPLGLDERAGEDGVRLSGGERQRLLIARALLTDAPILVLDEATTNLDPDTQRRVLEGVRRWRHGLTTIVIAHDAGSAAGVDLHLQAQDGTFVRHGLTIDLGS